jgi:tripartite-type tricarboxylate transporter receptor subunit TctC
MQTASRTHIILGHRASPFSNQILTGGIGCKGAAADPEGPPASRSFLSPYEYEKHPCFCWTVTVVHGEVLKNAWDSEHEGIGTPSPTFDRITACDLFWEVIMRRFAVVFFWVGALCMAGIGVGLVQAQSYPSQTIQLVIPAAPGDGGDIAARLLIEELVKILKVPVVPVNKPGAAAAMGTDFVAKSKKDGYTLLYGITAGTVYSPAQTETPYDPIRDLDCLGFTMFFPCLFSVQAESSWKSFKEVVDYAKKNPGQFRCSTLGMGSINDLQIDMIKAVTKMDISKIPFKGATPAVTGLLGGHVEATFIARPVTESHHKSGKLRALLVDRKLADLPEVPTLRELGYDLDLPSPWAGIYGPAGMPEEVKKVLVPAIEQAMKSPEIDAKLKDLYFLPSYMPPAEQRKLQVRDYENARAMLKKAGGQ